MKWAGIGLLALSIAAFGYLKRASLAARARVLRAAETLCRRVGEEIRFTAAPPPKIFAKLAAEESLRDLPFLADFQTVSPEEYHRCWQNKTTAFAKKIGLSNEDASCLAAFGAALGKTDTHSQTAHCAAYAERFKVRVTAAENETAEKGRLYGSLGLLGALAAALICI